MEGWIKLHRKILDNPIIFKDKDYLAIWIYLLLNATHKEIPALFKGKKIILQKGQLITGRKSISKQLDISESKTYRVLNAYKSEHQIEQQISNRNSLITIVNWDKYQITEQQIEQQVNSNRTASEQQVNTNKNIKNIKNEIIYNNIVKIFNEKCFNLSKIKKVTDKRKKAIDKFLKEYTQEQFEEICIKANESNFLTGKNERGWKADFDFLLRTDKATSILEGKYDNIKSNKVTNYNNYKQREYDNLNYIYANRR